MKSEVICHEIGRDDHFKMWHALDEHMFIYIYSEGGSIVCNEKIYPMEKGTLCFIGSNKYHYTMPDEPDFYDRSKLFVAPKKMEKILNAVSDDKRFDNFSYGSLIYSVIPSGEAKEAEGIFEELEKYKDDEYFEEVVHSCCVKLMVMISRNSIEHIPAVSGAVNKAIDYINSNIFRDITIDEICRVIHISKYHFCRRFREHTGMTVMNYILKTRVVMAKNILLSEKISVSDISQRCGFSSLSYFCRTFKEETGLTPLEYRKRNSS